MTKVVVHILHWIPLAYLIYAVNHRLLGADPQEEMLHQLGLWALIYLLIGLSISPLAKLLKLSKIIRYRRMVGLYAAFYLLLHISLFFIFYLEMNVRELWTEIVERPYITVGMLASVMMLPLVVTSNRWAQRLLGKKWKQLHRLVYPISLLAIVHFIWQSKSDLNEPLIYLIWLALLFFLRII